MSRLGERNKRETWIQRPKEFYWTSTTLLALHLKTIRRFHDRWRAAALLLHILILRLFYLQLFPLFGPIKLMTASFSSLKKFSVAQIYETISKKTIPPWRASLIFLIMLSCLFDMNICCLQSDANTKYNEQIIFLLNNFWLSQNA